MIIRALCIFLFTMPLVMTDAKARVKTFSFSIPSERGEVPVELHGKESDELYLNRIAVILKKEAKPILDYFEYPPTSTIHMIVDSEKTVANGLTAMFPTNHITYYRQPPVGESNLLTGEEFLRELVLHEFTHVVHLDQTRGFPRGFRAVFGSIAKVLTALVPRWFSEGLATWSETQFTQGGRLRYSPLQMELNQLYLDPTFCGSIDCLDAPGRYPYGSHSYWVGSDFLGWLENQKSGTIRCLVIQNSKNIPFFLNSVFRDCTFNGMDAEESFLLFRNHKLATLKNQNLELEAELKKRGYSKSTLPSDRSYVWSQGSVLSDNNLYIMTQQNDLTRLSQIDLKTSDVQENRPSQRMSYLQPKENYQSKDLVYSASTYHDSDEPRSLYSRQEKSGQPIEGVMGDYYFERDSKKYSLLFEKNSWKLKEGETTIWSLPELYHITFPRLINGRLYFITYAFDQESPYQIWSSEFNSSPQWKNHWSSVKPIFFMQQCAGTWLIKNDQKIFRLAFESNQTKSSEVQLPEPQLLSQMKGNYLMYQVSPGNMYQAANSCQDYPVRKSTSVEVKNIIPSIVEQDSTLQVDSYPSLSHYLPHYWILNYVMGTSSDAVSAQTSIEDPMETNSLSLEARYYTKLKLSSADATYTHSFSWFDTGLSHFDRYTQSSLRSTADKNESNLVFLSKEYNAGPFDATHRLSYSQNKVSDFISRRETQVVKLHNSYSIPRVLQDDFLQYGYLDFGGGRQKTKNLKDFWSVDSMIAITVRPAIPFYLHLRGSYARNFKKTLSSGGIFGGGEDSAFIFSRHNFLGIESSDAFGNEIWTYRLQGEYELATSYHGWGLFPLYMKRVNALLGAETLHADFIYLKSKKGFINRSQISNVHGGLRFKMDLFYLAPVDLDVLYVKNEFEDPELKMFLKASFFF